MTYTWLFFKKLMFNIQIQQNFILWTTWLHRYQNKPCGKQGLGNPQWITDHCQKGFFWVCGKSRFHEKGKAFHLHSKYQDVSLYLESSWKHKGGWQEDPSTLVPKVPAPTTGTFTGEGPSLQLVPITHWQEPLTTETPGKEIQHLHKALNINELLRAAFALWACASWNRV